MDRIAKLREFLLASPEDSFLKHALALECIKIGSDEEARELFESILGKDPEYVGSYYHLGKLLQRKGEKEKALDIYTNGMKIARLLKDNHAYNELQGAYDDLMD